MHNGNCSAGNSILCKRSEQRTSEAVLALVSTSPKVPSIPVSRALVRPWIPVSQQQQIPVHVGLMLESVIKSRDASGHDGESSKRSSRVELRKDTMAAGDPCMKSYSHLVGATVQSISKFGSRGMYLLDLPPELLIQILNVATAVHPIPAHVLVLNKFIYGIAAPILYRHPYFTSISAIARFPTVIWGSETVGKPSTIAVHLAGAEVGRGAFRDLLRLLSTTRFFMRDHPTDNLTRARLELEDFRLCLHSTNDGETDDKSLRALEFVE